ncbi:hypothetical protein [Roseateles saccharophilus]|uniref:Uncharacterized protein n=1 Tax=Roseateles saccharophilus TaxID=304 RepID=A0A4R3UYA2_ROSSA|nr:hypothetical protein [Roseateles saccharophilus]MDG0835262.1 hypothetical protein [Roseateles saccharophilus]TCU96172.1 hypothetical protein EV671_101450 [Roseateles saccharophilus]
MKALVLAAALAALSATALAGATREPHPQAVTDTATAALIADAGRLGSASLTALNGSGRWAPAQPGSTADNNDFGALATQLDGGTLLIALVALALGLSRPLSRALRRQEQQRRATALASTLGHAPHG